jgi:hypothetical protein
MRPPWSHDLTPADFCFEKFWRHSLILKNNINETGLGVEAAAMTVYNMTEMFSLSGILNLSLLMSYIYMELLLKLEILTSYIYIYIWTYVWQPWKPPLSICCTMFQHWINAETYPVSQLCVNILPATNITLITNEIYFGTLWVKFYRGCISKMNKLRWSKTLLAFGSCFLKYNKFNKWTHRYNKIFFI